MGFDVEASAIQPRRSFLSSFSLSLFIAPIDILWLFRFMGFGVGKKLQQSHPDEALGPVKLAIAGAFSGKT